MIGETNKSSAIALKQFAGNSAWNLVGSIVPLLIGLVTIPALNQKLGTSAFGILTLAWLIVGYFNLFDLGLGRTVTKLVAEHLGSSNRAAISPVFWTSLAIMSITSMLVCTISGFSLGWILENALNIPDSLAHQTLVSFKYLIAVVPIVVTTTGLRGLLEAYGRFDLVNAARLSMGVYNYAAPLVIVVFWRIDLSTVIGALAVGRILAWVVHFYFCFKVSREIRNVHFMRRAEVRSLLRLSGWMSISTMVFPLLELAERFLIASMVSVAAVAYYSVPYELITKLWLIPGAIAGVLFPMFSSIRTEDLRDTRRLYVSGTKAIFLLLLPCTFSIATWANWGLRNWMGESFAEQGTAVLQLLAIGVLVNSLSQVPFSLMQARGHAGTASKILAAEIVPYLVISWIMLDIYGVIGAAIVWSVRGLVDTAIFFWIANRITGSPLPKASFVVLRLPMMIGLLFILALLPSPPVIRLSIYLIGMAALALISFRYILTEPERDALRSAKRTAESFRNSNKFLQKRA